MSIWDDFCVADIDPEKLWVIPEDAWNQVTGVWDILRDRVGITQRFKHWWLRRWHWSDSGWVPKRKEENGTS